MKKKALISAILTIALCLSIISGSTFALFTSESKVDVAARAANVEVVATAENFELTSSVGDNLTETNAKFDKNTVSLENIVPGDTVTFDLRITNNSSVTIKYKTVIKMVSDKGLWGGLAVTIDGVEYDGAVKESDWVKLAPGDADVIVPVVVTLPETAGNEYKLTSCTFAYTVQAVQGNASIDTWVGAADTSWYNDTDTEFTMTTAEQLAGLSELVDAGNTFAGKTIKLDADMDLYVLGADGEPVSFEPLGSMSDDVAFEGTFDGQGHTISNMYQNGWALANGYWDGPEYGMGFFSLVENAVVKNVNFDGADLPSEANIMGVVAGAAANSVFENINITDAYLGNHSWYSGGVVGWAEGDVKLINCDVDSESVVSSQWGDFNNANGGLIGGIDPASTILLKDCDVACVIDAYNDVTSAYEWYSYRNCGMLIGDTGQKDDPDGDDVGNAIAPNLTCENVTVTYGDWAKYHYCEFGSSNYPFCRVEAGETTGAYGNARVGDYYDANGNKVVDDNHVHNDGEKHNELIIFDQLYGGATGARYCTYGAAAHEGVTVVYP